MTLNLSDRTDDIRNKKEMFAYDALNRLTGFGDKQVVYADNGNIIRKSDAGTLGYASDRPYAVSSLSGSANRAYTYNNNGEREQQSAPLQQITFNSLHRPATITANGYEAVFKYNTKGDRKQMILKKDGVVQRTKYYLGDNYETDDEKSILYLDGDAYSAPVAYVKVGGEWKLYYICRDYLGSITQIANSAGALVQELSYDAWGRLRSPETQEVYASGEEPALFLDRGYTGHEHLSVFGLINMNARLYDPVLGRFVSPDPYMQLPDFTQGLNRYGYGLNNPLCYVDENGELLWFIPILVGAAVNVVLNWDAITSSDNPFLAGLGYAAVGGVAGGLGFVAGSAAAAAVGVGGALGGMAAGAAGGAASGAALGMGNTAMAGGDFADIVSGGVTGMAAGTVGGALTGGVTGGVTSYAQGANVWTGEQIAAGRNAFSLNNTPKVAQAQSSIPAESQPNPYPEPLEPQTPMVENQNVSYSVRTGDPIRNNPMLEGKQLTLRSFEWKGYTSPAMNKTDLFHRYPVLIDKEILKNGWVYGSSGNSTMMVAPGTISTIGKNGNPVLHQGVYTVGVNTENGLIYHRAFYTFDSFAKDFHFPK